MTTTTISIIGTAGRTVPEGYRLSKELYEKAVAAVEARITAICPNPGEVRLVSGGAAWCDHIAVALFLTGKYKGLTLYLPAAFDFGKGEYVDTGDKDWRKNPGRVSNFYFQRFDTFMGRKMGEDLTAAFARGAHFDIGTGGFHSRNSKVAKSDYVIAVTWGDTEPEDGGTVDTWKKVPKASKKHHISLKQCCAV